MNKVEGIKSSIKKWEEIREKVKAHHISMHYIHHYWNSCGYCKAFSGTYCSTCPLYESKSKKYGIVYCFTSRFYPSVAYMALRLAGQGEWINALEYIDNLLAKMRRDLKKWMKLNGQSKSPQRRD